MHPTLLLLIAALLILTVGIGITGYEIWRARRIASDEYVRCRHCAAIVTRKRDARVEHNRGTWMDLHGQDTCPGSLPEGPIRFHEVAR